MRVHAKHAGLTALPPPSSASILVHFANAENEFLVRDHSRHWALLPRKTAWEESRPTDGTDLNSTSRNVNTPAILIADEIETNGCHASGPLVLLLVGPF
jgi:hypothetical protein